MFADKRLPRWRGTKAGEVEPAKQHQVGSQSNKLVPPGEPGQAREVLLLQEEIAKEIPKDIWNFLSKQEFKTSL